MIPERKTIASILRRAPGILVAVLLIFWAIVQLYPILYMFMTSVKTDKQILNAPFALPDPLKLENYILVWQGDRVAQPFSTFFLNSSIITLGSLAILLFVAGLAGYSLARGRFPGNAATQQGFLLTLAVPVHVLIIPMYFFMGDLGLRNSHIGMMLVYATLGLPFTIILMRAYFLSFPRELEESALLDGCSRFGAFIRVVAPVSRGAIASMAIINISWIWSELLFALVLLDQQGVRTLPLAVAGYRPASMTSESVLGQQFAIMSLTALPLFVFYFLFQQQIRKGMTAGALR
ncbi:MAG: carbohydrate ABC transporter permease [Chloroflexota bacterium]|nr:carbohydrate ABC transporter permease [Chloroflexota bacterium]MDE2908468.1 carbohydrate ABC transporter permease [Chloroflexota bacterium]